MEQLRTWAPEPDEAIWVSDTSTGAAGHPEITSDDPLYKKLSSKFSKEFGAKTYNLNKDGKLTPKKQ